MAIYHCSVKIIGRSTGRSAVAAAAYRAGDSITNAYDGITHDYSRKQWIEYSEIILPSNAPEEYAVRSQLWNSIELAEKSSRAQLAREFELALPLELNFEEQKELVREFVQNNLVSEGMIVDFAIHNPPRRNDRNQPIDLNGNIVNKKSEMVFANPHAHILATLRPMDADGKWQKKSEKEYLCIRGDEEKAFTSDEFKTAKLDGWKKQYQFLEDGEKGWLTSEEGEARKLERINRSPKATPYGRQNPIIAAWNNKEKIFEWRREWEECVNSKLQERGFEVKVDSRSYAEQGVNKQPSLHLGPAANNMARRYERINKERFPSQEVARPELWLINHQIKNKNKEIFQMEIKLDSLRTKAIKELNELEQELEKMSKKTREIKAKQNSIVTSKGKDIRRIRQLDIEEEKIQAARSKLMLQLNNGKNTETEQLLEQLHIYEESLLSRYGLTFQEYQKARIQLAPSVQSILDLQNEINKSEKEKADLLTIFKEKNAAMKKAGIAVPTVSSRKLRPVVNVAKSTGKTIVRKSAEAINEAMDGREVHASGRYL